MELLIQSQPRVAPGQKNTSAQQAPKYSNVGTTLTGGLVFTPSNEPLHMPYIVHTQYGIIMSLQHDVTLPKE